jgi:phosphoribosylaminoimidazole-succinocarboxamide synthase
MASSLTHDQPKLWRQGKVRDIYDEIELYETGDPGYLVMVATDRISTFDVVHPNGIPDKGKVLTGLSVFWFEITKDICPNHFVSYTDIPASIAGQDIRGRALRVKKLENMVPLECVVRGYLAGSAWKDYRATGAVCGQALPADLRECERLPEPLFTPATKAEDGAHDENVSLEQAAGIVGDRSLVDELKRVSIALYARAADYARDRGIILADTKFEFGMDPNGSLVLADEVLTPDSSRFWPVDTYEPGRPQPSFDKQYVRDWATAKGWDKEPPAPALPDEVVRGTRARFIEAYERITEEPFAAWLARSRADA